MHSNNTTPRNRRFGSYPSGPIIVRGGIYIIDDSYTVLDDPNAKPKNRRFVCVSPSTYKVKHPDMFLACPISGSVPSDGIFDHVIKAQGPNRKDGITKSNAVVAVHLVQPIRISWIASQDNSQNTSYPRVLEKQDLIEVLGNLRRMFS